jgi:hypothetical protein
MAKIYSFSNAVMQTTIEDNIKEFKQKLIDSDITEMVGKKIVTLIQGRTREGKAADGGAFKELSPSYREHRNRIAQGKIKTATGKFFKPNLSNLNLTGQMIDSITYETSPGVVHVFVPDSSRAEGLTNKEVADRVSEERPFMELDEQQKKTIDRLVEREANKIVREIISRT